MKKKPTLITYELVEFDPNSGVDFLAALPIPEIEPKFARAPKVKQPRAKKAKPQSIRPGHPALPQPQAKTWTFPAPAPRATPQPRPLSHVIPPAPPAFTPQEPRSANIQERRTLPPLKSTGSHPNPFLQEHQRRFDAEIARLNRVINNEPDQPDSSNE